MDRTLVVMRHAVAPVITDKHDIYRQLDSRGRRDAKIAGNSLKRLGNFDQCLVSNSLRTTQTWEVAQESGASATRTTRHRSIYDAPAEAILALLHQLPDDTIKSALVIGHLPSVEDLVRDLAVDDKTSQWRLLKYGYPTSTMCRLSINGSWSTLGTDCATLEHVCGPRI